MFRRFVLALTITILGSLLVGTAQENPTPTIEPISPAVQSANNNPLIIVQPNEVAVVFNIMTGMLEEPLFAGSHLIDPLTRQVIIYNSAQQMITLSGDSTLNGESAGVLARSRDGQEVVIDVSVLFGINMFNVNFLHMRWQQRYTDDFVRPTLTGIIRDTVAEFTAEDLWSAARAEWIAVVEDELSNRMEEEGLLLSDLFIRNITFSQAYTEAIELRVIAEQNLQQAELEAEQARIEAQREADISVIQAQALAERLHLIGEQIMAYPLLIFVVEPISLEDAVPSE
jgi:regulator of protease activity HflC (stomatin/prohibitin superfamily)